jgi:hypothetical protein
LFVVVDCLRILILFRSSFQSKVPTAVSPNFLQTIKIPIDLPINRLYAPFVDIEVRDVMFGGLVKRLLGTASLDLAEFMLSRPEDNDKTRWGTSGARVEVLDEKQLAKELQEEEEMRKREREAAIKKAEQERLEKEAAKAAQDKAFTMPAGSPPISLGAGDISMSLPNQTTLEKEVSLNSPRVCFDGV